MLRESDSIIQLITGNYIDRIAHGLDGVDQLGDACLPLEPSDRSMNSWQPRTIAIGPDHAVVHTTEIILFPDYKLCHKYDLSTIRINLIIFEGMNSDTNENEEKKSRALDL